MNSRKPSAFLGAFLIALALAFAGCTTNTSSKATVATTARKATTLPVNSTNIYRDAGANMLNPKVINDLPRVYVPNRGSDTVSVIDPATLKVVDTFPVGHSPQHIVPSYDMRTLWVTNNAE